VGGSVDGATCLPGEGLDLIARDGVLDRGSNANQLIPVLIAHRTPPNSRWSHFVTSLPGNWPPSPKYTKEDLKLVGRYDVQRSIPIVAVHAKAQAIQRLYSNNEPRKYG
jgi:hypothetical protein